VLGGPARDTVGGGKAWALAPLMGKKERDWRKGGYPAPAPAGTGPKYPGGKFRNEMRRSTERKAAELRAMHRTATLGTNR